MAYRNFTRRGQRGTPTRYGNQDSDQNRLLQQRLDAERTQSAQARSDIANAYADHAAAARNAGVAGVDPVNRNLDPRSQADASQRLNFLQNGGPRFTSRLPFSGGPSTAGQVPFQGFTPEDAKAEVDAARLRAGLPSTDSVQAAAALANAAGQGRTIQTPYGMGSSTVVPSGQPEGPAVVSDTGVQRQPLSWHEQIMQKYPAIGQRGSEENADFVKAFKDAGSDPAKAMSIADNLAAARTSASGSNQLAGDPASSFTPDGGETFAPIAGGPTGGTFGSEYADPPSAAFQAGQTAANSVAGAFKQAASTADQNFFAPVANAAIDATNLVRGAFGAKTQLPYVTPYTPDYSSATPSASSASATSAQPSAQPDYTPLSALKSLGGKVANYMGQTMNGTSGSPAPWNGDMSASSSSVTPKLPDDHPLSDFSMDNFARNEQDDDFFKRLNGMAYENDGE